MGLVALAGVQLSTQTITDGVTRTVLIVAACAGSLYTALWYFPVLMVIGALLAVVWDLWVREKFTLLCTTFNERSGVATQPPAQGREEGAQRKSSGTEIEIPDQDEHKVAQEVAPNERDSVHPREFSVTARQGIVIILAFFAIFITLMVLRSTIDAPVDLRLFTNLFLAGRLSLAADPS